MKKRGWMVLLALLGSLLLTSAMAWTEADYRTVTVEGQDYVLGESTLADFVEAGWTHYTEESDGVISLLDEANQSYVYVQLAENGGSLMQRPVIGIDLRWADGIAYSYCGLSEPDVWTEVQSLFDTYEDEEGDLIGEAKLDTCTIYMLTAGTRLSLFYDGEASAAAAPAETGRLTDDDLVLKPTAAQSVTYVTYTQPDGDFTMQIPAGWEVTTTGDYISYVLVAYDPANAARGLLIQLTGVGFQSADAVVLMEQSYGVHFPVMPEATTKGYFESWHTEVGGTFTVLENLGKLGDAEVLHARAVINGVEMEGLYTASVASLEYNMGINLSMTLGTGIQMLTAPVGELRAWLPVLSTCAGSLQFSEAFMQARQVQWQQTMGMSQRLSQDWQETSDGLMDAWQRRSDSMDIQMQEQSDATLGYDQVVDTETGKVYRVADGLMDSYDGTRLQRLEDHSPLYQQPLAGSIERK